MIVYIGEAQNFKYFDYSYLAFTKDMYRWLMIKYDMLKVEFYSYLLFFFVTSKINKQIKMDELITCNKWHFRLNFVLPF